MAIVVRNEYLSEPESKSGSAQDEPQRRAVRFYLYHNNARTFHEVRSGMRIGRGATDEGAGQVIRVEDSLVSKEHCRIWIQGNVIFVEDLGAVNSTQVNSVPMQPGARRKILLHDVLELGGQRFILTHQNRHVPAFTEDLSRRRYLPHRARRKGDGSLTAVIGEEYFQETLVALSPSKFRELRMKSALRDAGTRVRQNARKPEFRQVLWFGILFVSSLVFLFGGELAHGPGL